MKRVFLILGLAAVTFTAFTGCSAPPPRPAPVSTRMPIQTPIQTSTPSSAPGGATSFQAIDAFVQARQLGRGVNFGNALEAPREGEWGMVLEEEFFQLVKDGGFDTIRLPVRWSAHALREPPYTIDEAFFARVDWAVDNALARGLNIVVNMHHYEELFADVNGERERFAALWDQIATRYQDKPAALVFEPLNEPHGALTSGMWQRLFDETLAVIRKTNPERNVIFTGADWGGPSSLRMMKRPDDPHLIATFHYYLPFPFTHQGAEWVEGSDAWIGKEWLGKSNDRVSVDFDMDQVAKWAKDNNIPLWMGEFGSYGKYADMESRQRWTAYVARAAEKRGISWAYWEFGAGFGVYDREQRQWVEPILTALVPR